MIDRRILIAGASLAAFVLLLGTLRIFDPRARGTFRIYRFGIVEAGKLQWHDTADIVIAGDSRAELDINPEEIEKWLSPDVRVRNCSISGQGLSEEAFEYYFDVFRKDPKRPKLLVIGLSDTNFRIKTADSFRIDFSARSNWAFWKQFLHDKFCEPINNFELNAIRRSDRYFSVQFRAHPENGWNEVRILNESKQRRRADSRLPGERTLAQLTTDEQRETADFLRKKFCELRDAGIRVFLFVPPTPDDNFSDAFLKREFSDSGATILSLPERRYSCFDGSHLDGTNARAFSAELGKILGKEYPKSQTKGKSVHAL